MPTAHLDKIVDEGEATTPTTRWFHSYYTRLSDGSKDQFVSEVDNSWDGPAILSAIEGDTGETFD